MLGNSRSPPPPTSLSRLRMPTDWLDRGTRCARRIFVRLAGMLHTRFRKSTSERSANRNSPGRAESETTRVGPKRVWVYYDNTLIRRRHNQSASYADIAM